MDYNTNCIADFHHKYPLPDCNSPQIQVLTAYCASDEQNNVPKLLEQYIKIYTAPEFQLLIRLTATKT